MLVLWILVQPTHTVIHGLKFFIWIGILSGLKWKDMLVFLSMSATRNMEEQGNHSIIHKLQVQCGGCGQQVLQC